jgi:ATP-dependent Clp protease ATP-binding subunit ClpA
MAIKAFTDRGRQIITGTLSEVETFQSHYVGTEHLALALCKPKSKSALTVYDVLAPSCEIIYATVVSIMTYGKGDGSRSVPQTQDAKQTLLNAMKQAESMDCQAVNPEHLMLGMLELKSDPTVDCIRKKLGDDFDAFHKALRRAAIIDRPESPPIIG